jgi:nitrogen fixation protein NifU and related proteins
MTASDLYQEIILDHYRHPHGRGLQESFDAEVHHVNPTCGDEVTVRVAVRDGAVANVTYEGEGCSISQASTSVMTELVTGRSVADAMSIHEEFLAMMQSRGLGEPSEAVLGDGVAFHGVARYPARIKCALLGWMAWKDVTAEALVEDITEAMRDVVDPELGINVVDLGLLYGVTVGEDKVAVLDMTLTSAACPLTDVIEDQARSALAPSLVDDIKINWVWMPPWGPDKITDEGREQLRSLGFNV